MGGCGGCGMYSDRKRYDPGHILEDIGSIRGCLAYGDHVPDLRFTAFAGIAGSGLGSRCLKGSSGNCRSSLIP